MDENYFVTNAYNGTKIFKLNEDNYQVAKVLMHQYGSDRQYLKL